MREEDFTNRTISEGNISLMLGSGIPTVGNDPGLTLNAVYNNTVTKTGLNCINAANVVTLTNQTYIPSATDGRIMRVTTTINTDEIIANFNMKSLPYAIQAESVGGKEGADILIRNTGTQLSQANLENLLGDATKLTNLLNIANSGQAITAATATSATNATNATNAATAVDFSGSLAGDVTGIQSATVVSKLRGVNLSATAPTSGQVLAYDGSQYIPTTPAAAAVTSVNGQTGAVVLNASHIAGALTSASALTGDVTGNISATVVSSVGGKSAAAVATTVNDVASATANATASTLVKRDASGNITASTMSATNNSTQNIYLYEVTNTNYVRIKAPNIFSNYILTLPTDDGANGQMLQTDGSGNLSWAAPGGVTSASIITALGYTPADNAALANYPTKANNLSDLASATVARTNLGLGDAAMLNVGAIGSTVAAGDDVRITGALSQTSFNAYVASASCTTAQTMYWNSVSSTFSCQSIALSSGTVIAALGYTPANSATALSTSTSFSGDVSGNYNSTVLANSGVAAGTYAMVTVDAKGRVTSGNALTNTNITTALGFTPISNSLTSAQMYLGNGSNVAAAVTMSGDATIANTGAVTLKNTGTAGTYGASNTALTVTTDAQGRVTAVSSNPVTIVASQVTNFAATVIATVLPGFSTGTVAAVTAADSILVAIGKLQAQLNTILNPATTMVTGAGSNVTTTSTTDVLMTGMTITPAAGTYQVNFVTSVTHGTADASVSISIYSGGSILAASTMLAIPKVSSSFGAPVAATLNHTTMGEVTVNGAQAIEIRWKTSAGTATSVSNRMLLIHRIR